MLFTTLRHYLGPYRGSLLAVLVLKIVETIAVLSLPTLNADIINDGVVAGDTGRIWSLGGLMLAITAVQGAVAIIGTRLSARAAMGLGRRMRRDIFIHVQRFNPEEVSRFGAPSLVTRSTNDIQQIQMVVFMVCAMMLMAPIMLMGGTFMALRVDVPLSGLILVLIPLLLIVVGVLLGRLLPHFRVMQERIDRVGLVMREQIQGVRVIRAFVRQGQRRGVFEAANDELTATSLSIGRLFAVLMPSVTVIMNLAGIGVYWFGGRRIDGGDMAIGDLTAFLNYMMHILFSVMIAVMLVTILPRAQVAAARFQEVMAVDPAIQAPARPLGLPAPPGAAGGGPGRDARLRGQPASPEQPLERRAARPGLRAAGGPGLGGDEPRLRRRPKGWPMTADVIPIPEELAVSVGPFHTVFAKRQRAAGQARTGPNGGPILRRPAGYIVGRNQMQGRLPDDVAAIGVPVLVLPGGADAQVYPDKDYPAWRPVLDGKQADYRLFDGLNHLFMPVSGTSGPLDYNTPNHVDPQVVTAMADRPASRPWR